MKTFSETYETHYHIVGDCWLDYIFYNKEFSDKKKEQLLLQFFDKCLSVKTKKLSYPYYDYNYSVGSDIDEISGKKMNCSRISIHFLKI